MSNDKIRQLIGQPEGQQLEYKSVVPLPAIITRTIGAFANTEGGVLIFGVKDDLTISGLSEDVPAAAIVEGAITRLSPRPNVKHYPYSYSFEDSNHSEQRLLYIVEVEKSPTTVFAEDNTVLFREGAYSRAKMPGEKLPTNPIRDIQSINEVLGIINQSYKKLTESKRRIIEHYKNLLLVAQQATKILVSNVPQLPSQLSHGRTLQRLLFCSILDIFEAYLVDLLFEIFLTNPNTLKSSSTLTTEEVLNCQDMSEVIELAATKRVQNLTKGNEDNFIKAFQITGIAIFLDSEISEAKKLFQIRHLYTHRNGRVDEKFLSKVSATELKNGDEYKISVEDFCKAIHFFIDIVNRVDTEAITRHGLETLDEEEES